MLRLTCRRLLYQYSSACFCIWVLCAGLKSYLHASPCNSNTTNHAAVASAAAAEVLGNKPVLIPPAQLHQQGPLYTPCAGELL